MSACRPPWGAFGVADVVAGLKNGDRLQRPPDCPDQLYELCLRCWAMESTDRPSFPEINDELQIMPAILRNSTSPAAGGNNHTARSGQASRATEMHNGYERPVDDTPRDTCTALQQGGGGGGYVQDICGTTPGGEGYVDEPSLMMDAAAEKNTNNNTTANTDTIASAPAQEPIALKQHGRTPTLHGNAVPPIETSKTPQRDKDASVCLGFTDARNGSSNLVLVSDTSV